MQAVRMLPRSNYHNVGFSVESADENENKILLEAREGEKIGLVYVTAYNADASADHEVILKTGYYDEDDEEVKVEKEIGAFEISQGETEVILESPDLGLTIDNDLVVEVDSEELHVSAWGVKA